MSYETSRCPRHPSQQIVGVCAVCLRERLVVLTHINLNGYVDLSRSSSQHSPPNDKARSDSVGGIVDSDLSAARKKIHNVFDGGWNTAIPGNASRSIRRSRSFSDGKSSVASVSEDAFLETKADIGQVRTRKKPLLSFFNLDDGSRQKANVSRGENVSNLGRKIYAHAGIGCKRNDDFISSNGARSKGVQTKATVKNEKLSKHEVFTDRLKSPTTYAASERSRSPSWLSSLFHRRPRKCAPNSREITDIHDERQDARSPIEGRRPPSHGRVRSSSWEGDRPPWEATGPSYETLQSYTGASAVNDASPFHSLHESEWEGRLESADMGIEQDLAGYVSESTEDYGYNSAARPFIRPDVDGVVLRAKVEGALRQILPPSTSFQTGSLGSDKKAKKDVSPVTMETPVTQESPIHDTEIEKSPMYQFAGRGWSHVWSGIGLGSSTWALKERTREVREEEEQEQGEEQAEGEEEEEEEATDDQTSTVSGTSSLLESSQESFYHGSAEGGGGLRGKENGMWWNAYHYAMQNNKKGDRREKLKEENAGAGDRRNRAGGNMLPSSSLESAGLLRFYLTPVRSGTSRAGRSSSGRRHLRGRRQTRSLLGVGAQPPPPPPPRRSNGDLLFSS